ncbi:MAG: SPASM domain-containing protein [Tepidisphaeraceae bacterium]|jgi:hypothetical protein
MNRDKAATGVVAVLSMLHEPAHRPNSAQRCFRDEPVLAWTLRRLGQSRHIGRTALLCWEDQLSHAQAVAKPFGADCWSPSPRVALANLDAVSAARRWSDGWRGGLAAACAFDRGFHGPWIKQLLEKIGCPGGQAVLLVDPASGLVDPRLIDALIDHAAAHEEIDFFFSQAAPGLSGVLMRRSLLDQLAAVGAHPGTLLAYRPDLPLRDPISSPSCVPIPAALARTLHRFTLESDRQIQRLTQATRQFNGQLLATGAEPLLHALAAPSPPGPPQTPRDVVLELCTRRSTRPVYWPGTYLNVQRSDLSAALADKILDELGAVDDLRLVLGGVGDPLLCPGVFDVIDRAAAASIAVAVETDLIGIDPSTVDRLADCPVDVISVYLPAATARTYAALMGIDGLKTAVQNLGRLVQRRQARRGGTPLIVPTLVKTHANLAEMEAWYDHWLRTLACAVIAGPSDYGKSIPDISAARMESPQRRPCARLAGRITILSDGKIVSCEQDVLGRQVLGNAVSDSILGIWQNAFAQLRRRHADGQYGPLPVCAGCSDWHRP